MKREHGARFDKVCISVISTKSPEKVLNRLQAGEILVTVSGCHKLHVLCEKIC